MNAKRCKELRRNLREQGIAVGEVRYRTSRWGVIFLDPRCGRAVYQAAKRQGVV